MILIVFVVVDFDKFLKYSPLTHENQAGTLYITNFKVIFLGDLVIDRSSGGGRCCYDLNLLVLNSCCLLCRIHEIIKLNFH
jgi:hypothetical protein